MGRLSNLAMVHIEQEIANKVDYSDIDIFASKKNGLVNLIAT
jgi:hypothetical protein